jgi:hypothetical protein
MKSRLVQLFAGILLMAGVGPAVAHHSFTATYDGDKRIEMEGVIKEVLWRNPHSFVRLDVKGEDGAIKTWSLEWGSVTQLSKAEVKRTTFRPGDVVKVAGEPARDTSSARMLLQRIFRPSDGFLWEGQAD